MSNKNLKKALQTTVDAQDSMLEACQAAADAVDKVAQFNQTSMSEVLERLLVKHITLPDGFEDTKPAFQQALNDVEGAVNRAINNADALCHDLWKTRNQALQDAIEAKKMEMAGLLAESIKIRDFVHSVQGTMDADTKLRDELATENVRLSAEVADKNLEILNVKYELRKYKEFVADLSRKMDRINDVIQRAGAKRLPAEQEQAAAKAYTDRRENLFKAVQGFLTALNTKQADEIEDLALEAAKKEQVPELVIGKVSEPIRTEVAP